MGESFFDRMSKAKDAVSAVGGNMAGLGEMAEQAKQMMQDMPRIMKGFEDWQRGMYQLLGEINRKSDELLNMVTNIHGEICGHELTDAEKAQMEQWSANDPRCAEVAPIKSELSAEEQPGIPNLTEY